MAEKESEEQRGSLVQQGEQNNIPLLQLRATHQITPQTPPCFKVQLHSTPDVVPYYHKGRRTSYSTHPGLTFTSASRGTEQEQHKLN